LRRRAERAGHAAGHRRGPLCASGAMQQTRAGGGDWMATCVAGLWKRAAGPALPAVATHGQLDTGNGGRAALLHSWDQRALLMASVCLLRWLPPVPTDAAAPCQWAGPDCFGAPYSRRLALIVWQCGFLCSWLSLRVVLRWCGMQHALHKAGAPDLPWAAPNLAEAPSHQCDHQCERTLSIHAVACAHMHML
jgi:hypothetical protein